MTNARTKTRAEVEAEFKQKYGRFDGFDENPYGFAESLIDQLASHPQYEKQLLAKAARLLQARRGATPQTVDEPQPDVPIVDANGNQTGQTYSAKQLKAWQEWNWGQQQAKLEERFGPLEQLSQRIAQAEQTAQIQEEAVQFSTKTLTELRADPYFKEHEAKVKAALIAHPEWGADVHRAYNHVLATEVIPTLKGTEQAKVLDHLKTQAAGATVAPGQSSSSAPPKFKSFGEAAKYYAEHPEESAAMANR